MLHVTNSSLSIIYSVKRIDILRRVYQENSKGKIISSTPQHPKFITQSLIDIAVVPQNGSQRSFETISAGVAMPKGQKDLPISTTDLMTLQDIKNQKGGLHPR